MNARRRSTTDPSADSREKGESGAAGVGAGAKVWGERIARGGWVGRGAVYFVTGLITADLGRRSLFGGGLVFGADASQEGALRALVERPMGAALVVLATIGLALFAAWQAATLVIDVRDERGLDGRDGSGDHTTLARVWLERAAKLIGTVFYASVAWSGAQLLVSAGGDGGWSLDRATSVAVQSSVGRCGLFVAGLVVWAVAARRGSRIRAGELDDALDLGDASDGEARVIRTLGRVGEFGRGLSFVVVGWFLLLSAVIGRDKGAGGLDAALQELGGSTIGAVAAIAVGCGFIAFGAFSAASARHRELGGIDV